MVIQFSDKYSKLPYDWKNHDTILNIVSLSNHKNRGICFLISINKRYKYGSLSTEVKLTDTKDIIPLKTIEAQSIFWTQSLHTVGCDCVQQSWARTIYLHTVGSDCVQRSLVKTWSLHMTGHDRVQRTWARSLCNRWRVRVLQIFNHNFYSHDWGYITCYFIM